MYGSMNEISPQDVKDVKSCKFKEKNEVVSTKFFLVARSSDPSKKFNRVYLL